MGKIIKENVNENLSEIEKFRLRNIAERKKIFEDLNFDSLKKKARAHIEYQKAQMAAKRLQCQDCGEKFPNESVKRNHIYSVHVGPRSSYPRVKKISKNPPKPRNVVNLFSQKYYREFPFISQAPDAWDGSKKAYCNICRTDLFPYSNTIRIHMNSMKHKKNVIMNGDFNDESVMGQKCEICKMISEDLTAHLMTHIKPCSVLIFKME